MGTDSGSHYRAEIKDANNEAKANALAASEEYTDEQMREDLFERTDTRFYPWFQDHVKRSARRSFTPEYFMMGLVEEINKLRDEIKQINTSASNCQSNCGKPWAGSDENLKMEYDSVKERLRDLTCQLEEKSKIFQDTESSLRTEVIISTFYIIDQ